MKNWLDRMFRGEAVTDAAYSEPETREEDAEEPALDGTYDRRPHSSGTQRRGNVVEFSRTSAGTGSGGGTGSGANFTRETTGFTREALSGTNTKEFRDSTGGGGFSGGGGGFGGGSGKAEGESADAYVVFKRLKDFQMASQVADRMVENKIVILNLESCEDDVARRVLDFVGGVAYACSSMVKRIAGRVFMITPKGVNADGEFFDEARNAGAAASGIRYDD